MNTIELMQKVIDHIEENLKSELVISELAEIAGFSSYHFYHLFSLYLNMPVAAYITKRRLYHAIYEIQQGGRLIDTALLYGFNTHGGFYKAFKREFGCSPTKYLSLNTAKKPNAVDLNREVKIMLTQTQIRRLLTHWDIDTTVEIKETVLAAASGGTKGSWSIGEKYILKTGKNISGIKTHLAISKVLQEKGMEGATAVKLKNGQELLVEEDRYYVLKNKIAGKALTPEERFEGDRRLTGRLYGEAIGRLHKALETYDDTIEANDSNLLNNVINWALPQTTRIMAQWGEPLPREFYEDLTNNFPPLYNQLPRHLIHRDANPYNIIFDNGQVNGFIDFDISERNVRLFDPCYCATGILSEVSNLEEAYGEWKALLEGILKGYDSICKLSEAEKRAVPYVIYAIQTIFIAWCSKNDAYKALGLKNRKMLLWLWENREEILSFF